MDALHSKKGQTEVVQEKKEEEQGLFAGQGSAVEPLNIFTLTVKIVESHLSADPDIFIPEMNTVSYSNY